MLPRFPYLAITFLASAADGPANRVIHPLLDFILKVCRHVLENSLRVRLPKNNGYDG